MGDGNGHEWLHEVQQAREEQQPAALKGLCRAGGAGTEVLMVAVRYWERNWSLDVPSGTWLSPGS